MTAAAEYDVVVLGTVAAGRDAAGRARPETALTTAPG